MFRLITRFPGLIRPIAAPRLCATNGFWTSPRCRIVAAALISMWAALNLLYLFMHCPIDLVPDEAHYWDWSRNLDWCYYSKGPLVAWLIRGGVELFGDVAIRVTGTGMPAVRIPAVACNVLLLIAVYILTVRSFRSDRLALVTVALLLTIPAIAVPAVLMTIDSPFLACWAWACVFTQRAVTDGGLGSWVAAGVVSALGVLAKYNMLIFPVCVGLFLITDSSRRSQFFQPGFWILCGLTTAGLLPIVLWNAQHEWVGFRHLYTLSGLSNAGNPAKPFINPLAFAEYLAGQIGVLFGYWFIAWAAAIVTYRPWRGVDLLVAFLWWASVPVWLVFAAAALKSRGQANWPAAAYVTGLVLAVGWAARQLSDPNPRYRRLALCCLTLAIVLGVTVGVVMRYPAIVRPTLAKLAGPPTPFQPTPVRKLDPTCRLCGWQELACAVDDIRDRIRAETGEEPLLATDNWSRPGELGFYCRGNPRVYTFSALVGERHSQYDLWRPNPVADAQVFRGRTFVYVGTKNLPDAERIFDRVGLPVEVIASDGGVPVAAWYVWVYSGYRGVPPEVASRRTRGY
jgi:hypothetical protein